MKPYCSKKNYFFRTGYRHQNHHKRVATEAWSRDYFAVLAGTQAWMNAEYPAVACSLPKSAVPPLRLPNMCISVATNFGRITILTILSLPFPSS